MFDSPETRLDQGQGWHADTRDIYEERPQRMDYIQRMHALLSGPSGGGQAPSAFPSVSILSVSLLLGHAGQNICPSSRAVPSINGP